MKITYIHHSSFVVEDKTENGHQIVLIFDYFEGTLPEFSPEAYLYVVRPAGARSYGVKVS